METIEQFLNAEGTIPTTAIAKIVADQAAFGGDVRGKMVAQIEHRSATMQDTLKAAETAGRERLLADEQRKYDRADTERRELYDLLAVVDKRTEQRNFVPHTIAASETREQMQGRFLGIETRALFGSSGAGTYVTPQEYQSQVFDMLAAESVALQSGIRVITTTSDSLRVPRVVSDPAASWTTEGNEITASDPDYNETVATPRKLAARVVVSNELVADSNPSIIELLQRQMVRALSLELDRAIFAGSGTPPVIRGLENIVGTQGPGAPVGAFADLDDFVDAFEALETENAKATAIVMYPGTWADLSKLKELTTGSNKSLLMDSAGSGAQAIRRSIFGVPVFVSAQLASGSPLAPTSVFVYDAAQVVLVRRADIRVEVDRSRLFNTDQSEVRAILRADLVVPNPKAVYVMEL